jgi:serine/threonine protein kinase
VVIRPFAPDLSECGRTEYTGESAKSTESYFFNSEPPGFVTFEQATTAMTKVRDILGPYRLTRLIRVGSSCQVWEAVQESDGKRFALKVLRPENRGDKQELGFLKHEYEVAKTLSNPRVIKIYEYRVEADAPFLVLELFSELNLKQALRRGTEGIAWLAPEIVEQAAEGLYYFHSKGWIHCDIKPDNFLVSREGRVKLIDFTISERKKSGFGRMFAKKKKTAQGTLSYMSPEQIRKEVLDERSDLYSFGCVLYELVAGRPPFTGNTPNDLLSKHISAAVPSAVVNNENVTQEFADLVKRMMAKNPANRPPSMWEFLKEFRVLKMFKSPPRKPDIDVFSEVMSVKNPDQLMRTPDKPPL